MKKILSFFLLLVFSLTIWGQQPHSLHSKKSLSRYNAQELAPMFDHANVLFKQDELKEHVNELCNKLNGNILIAKGSQVIINQSSGYLRMYGNKLGYEEWTKQELTEARKLPENQINSGTLFELASVSKQFTAAAVLQLAENHKLKLTDTLRKFFPQLPYYGITIHQLLSHTSGLPEYFDFPFEYFDTTKSLTNNELIRILSEQQVPSNFLPGEKFEYCNTNYMLLASIVAKVSKKPFEEYVAENIFKPAGMTHTFYYTQLAEHQEESIAIGHLGSMEELHYFFMDGTIGDKGVYSTVEDLFAWKKAYFDEKIIISEEWLAKATSPENITDTEKEPKELYGYGLRLENNPHYGKIVYHGGLWRGFLHLMVYNEDDDIFFIILSNHRNGAHKGEANAILHIFKGA